ncbi:hypothetical protein CkaCkLH20_12755 [Colletotrichum karsti]|uniref:Heterokaryon incompatibility domain-containing protein n=1 Tax=Colletotrichum karsti TaxID=1095194 RepID=A0A9P6HS78_9PEZI|nr:uncharacterized protein CkaCkLH20_12755 [Colletotrichum karsti]KAF9869712.1 hypothetical protein CkaCkLH20_12755 [Colletotrichum karsti]
MFAALLHLRHGSQSRRIWADAICIDQDGTNGNAEKNHQVQMMGEIYSTAEQTIVWLGDDADGRAARAFDLLDEINSFLPSDWRLEVPFHRYVADAVHPADYRGWILYAIDTLSVFFEKSWFHRIWIIQEVVKAKKAEVVIGHRGICFDTFQGLISMMSHEFDQNQERFNARAVANFHCVGEMKWLYETRARGELSVTPLALELLRITEWFQGFSVESDRIYALLSLAEYDGFRPNYDLPSSEAFREFAVWALRRYPRLAALSYARGGAETSCPAPSWALAPRIEGGLPYNLLHIDHFEADFGADHTSGPFFRVVDKFPCLFLTGAVVDTLQDMAPTWMNCSMARDKQQALLLAARVAGCDLPSSLSDERYARFCRALSFELEPDMSRETPETVARADRYVQAYISGGVVLDEHPEGEGIAEISTLWQSLARFRYFSSTDEDRFAWAPWTSKPGDKVCIIRGAKVPYVLRPLPQRGVYSLVGECWIQGLMEGEALKADGFAWDEIWLV